MESTQEIQDTVVLKEHETVAPSTSDPVPVVNEPSKEKVSIEVLASVSPSVETENVWQVFADNDTKSPASKTLFFADPPSQVKEEESPSPVIEASPNDNEQKPWYLSTKHIYALIKNAVASIPYSQTIFDKTVLAICTTTSYINKSTKLNVVVDMEDCHSIVRTLDETLSGLTMRADDGFDSLRDKLSASLTELSAALQTHRAWAEDFAARTTEDAGEASIAAMSKMRSAYESTVNIVKVALAVGKESVIAHAADAKILAEDRYKNTVSAVQFKVADVHSKVSDARDQTESALRATIESVLNIAQPYVHAGVSLSTPYVTRAVEMTQPYVEKAAPYVEPIVARATAVNASLLDSERFGSLVSQAEEAAQQAIEGTVAYCTPVTTTVTAAVGEE